MAFGSTEAKTDTLEAIGVNGRMRIDGDKLVINRRRAGLLAALTVGLHGEKVIPMSQITAVELRRPGLARGYFRISINGRDPNGGLLEAAKDENAIVFTRSSTKAFEKLNAFLIQNIGHRAATPAPASAASEIEKLVGLMDRGVLTESEFLAQKELVLNKR